MLINRGRVIDIYISAEMANNKELRQLNDEKRGRPFKYSNIVIFAGYTLKCITGRGYRWIQGFIENISKFITKVPKPNFRTIFYRMAKMKGIFNFKIKDNNKIAIAIDSTGIKQIYDNEYRTYRYDKRKDWFKLHIAADMCGRILNAKITKSSIGDSNEFVPLIRRINAGKVYADGAYDTGKIFNYCEERGIKPIIPVRINASKKHRTIRSGIVAEQFGMIKSPGKRENLYTKDYRKIQQSAWKKQMHYGKRWIAETAISAFKRTFGEYVFSKNSNMIRKEIETKVMIYNRYR